MVPRASSMVLLAACGGGELAKLEVEQQALQREVVVLRRHVETMRAEMQAIGMLPSGPAGAAALLPESELTGQLSFSAERIGPVPALPEVAPPERREETECGWRLHAPWLSSLSDVNLEKSGSGRASPVVLTRDGEPFEAHAAAPKYERQCAGAFRVQPKFVFFSPTSADDVDGVWALSLDERIPVPRGGDGLGMYWVYPGTTTTFTFDGWKPEWGDFEVRFDARLLPVGTPDRPNEPAKGQARVVVLGDEASASQNRLGLTVTPDPPRETWTVDVTTPIDGPYVLVETLVIGNDDKALVVASGGGT